MMMCTQGFKGCLGCGCEMDSGRGSCMMCGQALNQRSLLRILINSLKSRAVQSIGHEPVRSHDTLAEPRCVA